MEAQLIQLVYVKYQNNHFTKTSNKDHKLLIRQTGNRTEFSANTSDFPHEFVILYHQTCTFICHHGMVQLAYLRRNTNGLSFTPTLQLTNTSYLHRLRAEQYGVINPSQAKDFYHFQNPQTGSGAQAASYSMYKDKAIPLQALTGPEVSRRLRLPDFKTIGT
jgi:hypothetical protein